VGTSETLRSVIDAGRTGKRLDELTTARVIGKVAERLHAAQQLAGPGKSVGPITPTAIAIADDGRVTLELDKRGSALAYSAPEQVGGAAGDRRSDVFSLGCVMWEALTHQRLFDAMNDAAVKVAVGEREIKPPSEINANIPAELSAMCMKALSRTPSDRYASAKGMGVEIEEFLSEAGEEDSNAKVAQFLTGMKRPKSSTKPPPSILQNEKLMPSAAVTTKPAPPAADSQPITIPNTPPGAPERAAAALAVAPTTPGQKLANKLSSAETKPVEAAALAPSAAPLVATPAPPVVPAPSAAPLVATPAAPILPASKVPSAPILPATSKAPEPTAPPEPAAPSALAASLPPIESVGSFAPPPADAAVTQQFGSKPAPLPSLKATIAVAVPPPPSLLNANQTIPDGSPAVREAPVPDPAAPERERTNPTGSAPHAANPVDAVSLPRRAGRDSEQVLNKWAWQTDTTEAIVDDDHDYHADPPSRRPLFIAIGAGCGVVLIVMIIAFVGGGSSDAKKKPPPPAAMKEPTEPAPAPAPEPAVAAPAPAPGSAAAAGSDTGSAAQPQVATPEPPKQEPPPPPEPPKQEPPKQEPPKQEPPKQVAKTEPPKQTPPKQEPLKAPPKQTPPKQEPPKQVAKAEPPKQTPPKQEPPKASSGDVEAAYKRGLMQFARGDTQGALASLRTALAGNPNFAPTWRGLGLVFEKLGEKDQARAAFKRYLQLAPSAGDTEQIKTRMERLGS
jgi:hypothetical protein